MEKKIQRLKCNSKINYNKNLCRLNKLNMWKEEFNINELKLDYPYIATGYLPFSYSSSITNYDYFYNDLFHNSVNKLIYQKFIWADITSSLAKRILLDQEHFLKYTNKLLSIKRRYVEHKNPLYGDFIYNINSDPDPYFNGLYNWYYTGGTATFLSIEDQLALVKRNGPSFDSLEIIHFEDNCEIFDENTISLNLQLIKNQPIYHILSNESNGLGILGVRQQKAISIYQIIPNEESLQVKLIFRCPFSYNLTGFDFNPINDIAFVTSVNDAILLFDIEANKCLIKEHFKRNPKRLFPWNWPVCLKDPNLLLLADTHQIVMMDTRKGLKTHALNDPLCVNKENQCNNFCQLICHPDNENLYYAVSRHEIFLRDVRNLSSVASINVWSHWLKEEPCYIRFFSDCQNEGILISSQNGESSLALNNELAYVLPSIKDSLQDQLVQGTCLDLTAQLQLKQSISGMEIYQKKYGAEIIQQTAPGNIFVQNLSSKKKEDSEEIEMKSLNTSFQKWDEKFNCQSKPKYILKYTSKRNMRHAFTVMKSKKTKRTSNELKTDSYVRTWISKKKLLSYTNTLDTILLDIWDIKDEPEWAPTFQVNEEESLNNKILNWFSKQDIATSSNDAGLENVEEVTIDTHDVETTQNSLNESLNLNQTMSQEMTLLSQSSTSRFETPSKKRKLNVSGF